MPFLKTSVYQLSTLLFYKYFSALTVKILNSVGFGFVFGDRVAIALAILELTL
jgi:hypothetical protein